MTVKRAVIVGGGGGGDAAAFALRKRGFDGDVVILSADRDRPYDRPYLSKEFLRGEIELPKVFLHEDADYAREKVDLRLEQRVVGGSLGDRKLQLEDGGEIEFDVLVIATGGTPPRLLLVGAGFIGAEVAASARTLRKDVLMVESAAVPLARALGAEVGEVYAGIHRSRGVDLRTGTTLKEWHTYGGRVVGVTLADGTKEDVDLALVAIGIDPNVQLPRSLGLPVEGSGVRIDEGLKAADGVYCAGDIALHAHPVLGRSIRVEHWEVAKNQGRGVAASITGGHVPYTRLPYFWSDQYDVSLEYRGHAAGDDHAVWRGDRAGLRFSVFYLREGRVNAVLSMNDKKTNEVGGKLIEARLVVDPSALANESVDLADLVAAPS